MAKPKKTEKKAKVNEVKQAKKLPIGVQIISVLTYIVSILSALAGILFIIFGAYFSDLVIEALGDLGPGIIIFTGALMLCLGALGIFVGNGLWKRKIWARITAIILLGLTIIISVYNLAGKGSVVGNIIIILLSGVIGTYLIFSKEAKEAFK